MSRTYRLGAQAPALPPDGHGWIAPDATVIGDVRLAEDESIWFNAVLRADDDTIAIGAGSNVRDERAALYARRRHARDLVSTDAGSP